MSGFVPDHPFGFIFERGMGESLGQAIALEDEIDEIALGTCHLLFVFDEAIKN